MEELVEEFEGQFQYLGEHTEMYINFSVPTKKENDEVATYKIKLKIYSIR